MGFNKKIKYYLVHSLHYTNKQAQALIENGEIEIDGNVLSKRDAIGIEDANSFEIKILQPTKLLAIEIPMK